MRKVIVAYIPVLHEGYRTLFAKHSDARELFIFGSKVIASFEHLVKDIRKLDPQLIQKSIVAWEIFDRVAILNEQTIKELQDENASLVVSDDDITTELVAKYFKSNPIEIDTIFLRWDKKTAIEPMQVSPDVRISKETFDQQMITLAQKEGDQSPDWWRRLGALAVHDGEILLKTHNTYVPSDQIAYDQGDPRGNFKSGIHLESSLALHAEAKIISLAARDGVSLKDADVYVETFPCPPCAKLLAYSGIHRLFYRTGYKVLDGESILRSQNIEIVFVDLDT